MLANIDREVIGAPDVQILECKTAGMNGAKLWRDGVPEYVQLQVQHQLGVTGKAAADVAVLVCGNEYRCYRIERDDALIARLIEREAEFWDFVETDTPPPADGSDSAAMALQALFPNDNGAVLDFSEDAGMNTLFADYLAFRQQREAVEAQEGLFKQKLQERLGFATGAEFGFGKISWRKSKDSNETDLKKLAAENPELVSRYQVSKSGSRRFLVQVEKS
jgi:predicted phage-related endonuclease